MIGPGTVQARVPVTVAARITATVMQISADVGDTVKRGQMLAVLDDRDLAARRGVVGSQQVALSRNVEAAKATIAKAQAEFELARSKQQRDAELLRSGFVSQAVLDASEATLRAAQANLDNARAAHSAREADVQALSQEARYSDTVLSFSRITAPMDGVIIARQAEVGIVAGEVPGIVLPLTALTRDRAGRQGVLVVVDSRTAFRLVKTGISDGQVVLIGNGLAGGERVVATAAGVKAGMRVHALDSSNR